MTSVRYSTVRQLTERLCQPLMIEDYQLQSMPDCSPPKWHIAHTTWFFETFVLAEHEPNFVPHHPLFRRLFNSYYEAVGERWPRPARGLLSRPTVDDILSYRRAVDERMLSLIEQQTEAIGPLVELGLNHEQQHQELLLTDLKHAFALNPLCPVYCSTQEAKREMKALPLTWLEFPAGIQSIGSGGDGFAFDNELPRHRVFIEGFQIASRPATVGEYLGFIEDGGYERSELWLSDGYRTQQENGWKSPHYWEKSGNLWSIFTLHGRRPLDHAEPVCHLSYYEADAFARWAGARLPTEAEWEVATEGREVSGHFLDSDRYHPEAGNDSFYGDIWQWTASSYSAYPGYRSPAGALGEYNGKFMCNQFVLRGGSCVTPAGHIRPSYRNFFPPDARWQFSGLRLARDLA